MSVLDCVAEPEAKQARSFSGVVTGTLVGFAGDGVTPLVAFPGQPGTAAVAARSVVDLHGAHVGRPVVLMFDSGDARLPIVMGYLRDGYCPPSDSPGAIDVDSDGERLVVTAKEQIVLRCGKASITLTKTGKVLIQGAYVLSHSTGVNRIKGATVELN